MPLTIKELAFIISIIGPYFQSFTLLLVLEPVPFITATIFLVVILSIPMGLIILKFPFVDITISMSKTSPTVGFVFFPVSLILAAVSGDLNALAVFSVMFIPLAYILSSILESHHGTLNSHYIIRRWTWLITELLLLKPTILISISRYFCSKVMRFHLLTYFDC